MAAVPLLPGHLPYPAQGKKTPEDTVCGLVCGVAASLLSGQ